MTKGYRYLVVRFTTWRANSELQPPLIGALDSSRANMYASVRGEGWSANEFQEQSSFAQPDRETEVVDQSEAI